MFLCVYMCVCVCASVCVCMCVCVCARACMRMYVYNDVHLWVCKYFKNSPMCSVVLVTDVYSVTLFGEYCGVAFPQKKTAVT